VKIASEGVQGFMGFTRSEGFTVLGGAGKVTADGRGEEHGMIVNVDDRVHVRVVGGGGTGSPRFYRVLAWRISDGAPMVAVTGGDSLVDATGIAGFEQVEVLRSEGTVGMAHCSVCCRR
jgi:hypothetical protein